MSDCLRASTCPYPWKSTGDCKATCYESPVAPSDVQESELDKLRQANTELADLRERAKAATRSGVWVGMPEMRQLRTERDQLRTEFLSTCDQAEQARLMWREWKARAEAAEGQLIRALDWLAIPAADTMENRLELMRQAISRLVSSNAGNEAVARRLYKECAQAHTRAGAAEAQCAAWRKWAEALEEFGSCVAPDASFWEFAENNNLRPINQSGIELLARMKRLEADCAEMRSIIAQLVPLTPKLERRMQIVLSGDAGRDLQATNGELARRTQDRLDATDAVLRDEVEANLYAPGHPGDYGDK